MRKITKFFALGLTLCCLGALAQDEDIAPDFKRVNAQEETQLRAVLAEPVPANALDATLDAHFKKKDAAARRFTPKGKPTTTGI